MSGVVFSPYSLASGQTRVELMEIIWLPWKRLMPVSETPGYSQGSLAQRTVWT